MVHISGIGILYHIFRSIRYEQRQQFHLFSIFIIARQKRIFSTYAERIVINGLRTYCRLMCGKQKHHIQLPAQKEQDEEVFSLDQIPAEDTLEQLFEEQDIYILLQSMKQQYSGTIRLGIEAIEWKVKGFSGAEIAKMYGVKPNLVGAWISRASSRLKKNSDFMKYFNPSVEINSS